MRKFLLLAVLFCFGIILTNAQIPNGFNYQAVIRNVEGNVVANQLVSMRISILQGSTEGNSVYTETFEPTTNKFGLINLIIGSGTVVSGDFSTIDWSTANYYLKVEFDAAGGSSFTEMGITQLLSVPYANYAFSGNAGASAYQVWKELGNTGTEQDFINSLTGPKGEQGEVGAEGQSAYEIWLALGNTGTEQEFINTLKGPQGENGLSAYEVWLSLENTGTEEEFIASLTGPQGEAGEVGPEGQSAYEVWLGLGNTGTEQEFINSLTGPQGEAGADGPSAYEVWLSLGNTGTEQEFINSLTGPSGTSSWNDGEDNVTTTKKVGVGTSTPSSLFQVEADESTDKSAPLFEVKNSSGKTVFAVYENDVKVFVHEDSVGGFTVNTRDANDTEKELMAVTPEQTTIYVDSSDNTKGVRGGFAVSGRTSTKGETNDILNITPGLTQIFVDETTTKATRGGFAVSGRTTTKGDTIELMNITPGLTEFFVDPASAKSTRGGFAVSGRTTTKESVELMNITPDFTRFYVDTENTKATRGGFAVSGRTTTKESGNEILLVTPSITEVFVDDIPAKATRGGFAVSGRTTTKASVEMMNITPSFTRFYVDSENTKATRGGFAVSGRTTTKETGEEIFVVTPSITEVFVDDIPAKATRGGFAVSGRTTTKESIEMLNITPSFSRFYVDGGNAKATRGGFAVSGRTSTKGVGDEILMVSPDLTEVFVSETSAKATRGGFAVSGRTTTKETGTFDIMHVQPKSTDIYIKPDPVSKTFPDGFSISGLNENYEPLELFSVSEVGTVVNTTLAVAPKVTTYDVSDTTQTSAICGGAVTDSNDIALAAVGIIYNTTGELNINKDFSDPSVAGLIPGDINNPEDFPGLIMQYLTPGTTYQVRAFATNTEGLTGYGAIKTFTTYAAYSVTIELQVDILYTPIIDGTISIYSLDSPFADTITNTVGDYNFMLAAGSYGMDISAPGYYDQSVEITITSDGQISNVYMKEALPKVIFTVLDEIGNPVPNVYMDLWDGNQAYDYPTSNEDGEAVSYLAPGKWYIDIYDYNLPGGYAEVHDSITVLDVVEQTDTIYLTLLPTYTVTFQITRADGTTPAENAEIILEVATKSGAKYYSQTRLTNSSGYAEFLDVPEGQFYSYYVNHSASGEYYNYTSIAIDSDKDLNLTLSGVKKEK